MGSTKRKSAELKSPESTGLFILGKIDYLSNKSV